MLLQENGFLKRNWVPVGFPLALNLVMETGVHHYNAQKKVVYITFIPFQIILNEPVGTLLYIGYIITKQVWTFQLVYMK